MCIQCIHTNELSLLAHAVQHEAQDDNTEEQIWT